MTGPDEQTMPGDRVCLVSLAEPTVSLPPGSVGTAGAVGECGSVVPVQWDNGVELTLIRWVDRWEVINGGRDE